MSAELATTYLGLALATPIVASAGPLNDNVDVVQRLEAAGASAVVMPSLFEEEVLAEELMLNRSLEAGSERFAEALDYFPDVPEIATAGDRYVRRVVQLKEAVHIPVIASLNATTPGGWVRYAALLADAGADAIELNLYHIASDPNRTGAQVEDDRLAVVETVRATIDIPLAVKLSPYFSSMANFARRVVDAGADGLVLFNRFYQPDLDLEELEVVPRLDLSTPAELRLPLRWLAILRPLLDPHVSLAATSGVHSGLDAAKAIAVGADVAMTTSSLLHNGPEHVGTIVTELQEWLRSHEYVGVGQLRGSMSHASTPDPAAFERANYMKVLHSWVGREELGAQS